jgi:hypothetical protein
MDAMLWAAGVAWVGALVAVPVALLLDAALTALLAFMSIFSPTVAEAEADATGWVVTVAVAAMASCLVTALGSAWVLATTPGSKAPPWLVGTVSGVFGWAVGAGIGWLVLGA